MENNTMTTTSEKTILQRMADLITHEQKASTHAQQLHRISTDLVHFRHILEKTKKLSQEGKEEAKTLEAIYRETQSTISAHCNQLNKASMTTVKNVSLLVSSVRKNHLQKLTEKKLGELKKSRDINAQKIQRITASLHWKNIFTVIMITLVVASVVSLYVDNDWPWQAHDQILKQREAGKILLNAWPQLSARDRNIIVQNA